MHLTLSPRTLTVTRLRSDDSSSSPGSKIDHKGSAVARCLAHDVGGATLTLKAVGGGGGVRCRLASAAAGPILEVPVPAGGSAAHASIEVAAADSPTFVAISRSERPASFTLLDPTPSDINSF